MLMEEPVEKIELELERARRDLSQTLREVNKKAETQLGGGVEAWVSKRPLLAVAGAGAIGFICGRNFDGKGSVLALLLGGVLGFVAHATLPLME